MLMCMGWTQTPNRFGFNPCTLFGGPTGPTTQISVYCYVNNYAFRSDLSSNRYSPNNTQRSYEVSLISLTEKKLRGGSERTL